MSPLKDLKVVTNVGGELYESEDYRNLTYEQNQQRNPPTPPTDGVAKVVGRNRCPKLPTEEPRFDMTNEMAEALDNDLSKRNIKTKRTKKTT